jgi:predicted patatin/cPLA2 family phospholipase
METTQSTADDQGLGLVLEGGALRGLFTAGITDVMMERGVYPDGLIGVSAGAAFGCNMKSRQPGRVLRYNKRFAHDWRYCSLRSLLLTGDLFGGDFCYHRVPDELDLFDKQTFNKSPMKFYAVCTDVDTGEAVYQQLQVADKDCYQWIRASASMPLAAKIVHVGGRRLLDGGIADSIPLRYFQSIGYRRNIVVLTQPRDFMKTPSRMNPLINVMLRRHPRFTAASDYRHIMYNQQLDYIRQEEQAGRALVLAPDSKLPIGHISHDTRVMDEVYQHGREVATRRWEELMTFIHA